MRNAKPQDMREAADLSSLMRLMATKDGDLPLDKYVRFKNNIQLWYKELEEHHVPKEEVPILEKHYLPSYGVPNNQEQLMILVMDKDIAGFSELEANKVRKIIGKKKMGEIPNVKKKLFDRRACSEETMQYIWDTAVSVQMG